MTALDRRTALALLGAGVAALPGGALAKAARRRPLPWMASPEQIWAERIVMQLSADPAVKRIQAQVRTELMARDRARLPDAAATLDESIAQWTRSLIFAECIERPTSPAFIWATDDTPRTWMGYTLPGVGTSGDNPDAFYQTGGIEGGGRYEIIGQFHRDSRPTQLLIEVDKGSMAQAAKIMTVTAGQHNDVHSTSMISDRELVVNPDGSFRITLGGTADGPNHLTIPPEGLCSIGVRHILSPWTQRPARLSIRRLDTVRPAAYTLASVKAKVLEDLHGYMGFWAGFPDIWFGGLKANTRSEPMARPGGWGFVAGLNFSLKDDEAMVVTLNPSGAKYTGFQLNNPWMIAPDATRAQVCLNNSQTTPNADGTVTYAIARSDPGAANWLDTAGLRDGIGIMRWQAIPQGLTKDGLIRELKVVKLAELAAMADLPRVSAAERRAIVAARAAAYNSRTR